MSSNVYENTPKNQKQFDEFWNKLESKNGTLPKSCDQMVRQALKDIDTFNEDATFPLSVVKEILKQCLRGC